MVGTCCQLMACLAQSAMQSSVALVRHSWYCSNWLHCPFASIYRRDTAPTEGRRQVCQLRAVGRSGDPVGRHADFRIFACSHFRHCRMFAFSQASRGVAVIMRSRRPLPKENGTAVHFQGHARQLLLGTQSPAGSFTDGECTLPS
jgi:hypothetical protein